MLEGRDPSGLDARTPVPVPKGLTLRTQFPPRGLLTPGHLALGFTCALQHPDKSPGCVCVCEFRGAGGLGPARAAWQVRIQALRAGFGRASWSPLSPGATVVLPWEVEAAWVGGLEMLCLASPWPRGICAIRGAINESGGKLSFWAGVCTPHCLQPPCPGSGLPRSLVPCLETPMGSVCQDRQLRAPSTASCFPPLPWG